MSDDLETGSVPAHTAEILTVNGELIIPNGSSGPTQMTAQVSRVEIIQGEDSTGGINRLNRSGDARRAHMEAEAWKGSVTERIKLVQEGYRTLAIICTFLAGVQASILGRTFTQTGVIAQILNGFFFAGLVADIGAAILSAASQRWFEMIRREEAEHAFDYLEEGETVTAKDATELWVILALKAPPYAAITGFTFMVVGVMILVWSSEGTFAKVLCTIVCALLVILLPSFAIQHDRKTVLRLFKLKRVAG